MKTKENDLLLNMLANPDFSIRDFQTIGMSADNTGLESEDYYKNNSFVQEKYSLPNGNFDSDKFHKDYEKALGVYSILAQDTYEDAMINQATFHRDNILANPQQKRKGPDFQLSKVENPMKQQSSIVSLGKIEAPKLSVAEIAQTQKVYDPKTDSWHDSPNDSFFTDFFDTRVLAQYDEDGTHINPITGKEEEHLKGDYKLNDEGTYYYENLAGRSIYGRTVLNKMDTLTKDDSVLNKYDFFDSDDVEQKNPIGSIAKNAVLIGSMFLGGGVGTAITSLSIATQSAGFLSVLGKMLVGSDSPTLSAIEGWSKSVDRHNTTDYAKQNTWCWENFINLIGDVAGQLREQRVIFNKLPAVFKGSAGMSEKNQKKAFERYLKEESDKLTNIDDIVNMKFKDIENGSGILKQMKKYRETTEIARGKATARLNNYMESYNKIGSAISKAYMTAITVEDFYGEAKLAGASDIEATLFTLGYAAAEAALLNTKIGEHILPEIRDSKFRQKALIKALTGIKDSKGQFTSSSKAEKVSYFKNLFNKGKEIAKLDYTVGKRLVPSMFAHGFAEGTEEVSEEFLLDFTRSCYNAVQFLQGDESKLKPWEHMFERYSMAFVGGGIGGAINAPFIKHNSNNFTYNSAIQELVYMSRNNKIDDLLKTLDSMQLEDKNTSTKDFITTSDGETLYAPAANYAESRDGELKQAIRMQIKFIDDILKSEGANISDQSFLDIQTLQDLRYKVLQESTTAGRFLNEFNSVLTQIEGIRAELNNSNKTDLQKRREKDNENSVDEEHKKKLLERLEELRKQKDALLDGSRAPEFIADSLFEMTPALNQLFTKPTFVQYAEYITKKDLKDIDNEKLEELKKQFETWKNTEARDDVHLKSQVLQSVLVQLKDNLSTLESDSKKLNKNYLEYNHQVSEFFKSLNQETLLQDSDTFLETVSKGLFSDEFKLNFLNPEEYESITKEYLEKRKKLTNDNDITNLGQQYRNKILDKIYDKIVPLTKNIIEQGFINTETKRQLTSIIDNFLSIYFGQLNFIWEFYGDSLETKNLQDKLDTLNSFSSKIKDLKDSYAEQQLNVITKSLLGKEFNLQKLINTIDRALTDKSDSLSDFTIDETLINDVEEVTNAIDLYKAILNAAKVDGLGLNTDINSNESIVDTSQLWGYTKTLNSLNKDTKNWKELPEISSEFADITLQDLEVLSHKLKFYKNIYNIVKGQKLGLQNKVALNTNYILYNRMKDFVISIPDEWKGKDKLLDIINNSTILAKYSTDRKQEISQEEKESIEKERFIFEDAIYDFFQENKLNDIDKLSNFLSGTKLNLFYKTKEILNDSTEYVDDNTFIWYLASRAAIKSSDFYNLYKSHISPTIAPIPTQEFAIYLNYAAVMNGGVFEKFQEAYQKSILESWKLKSDTEKTNLRKELGMITNLSEDEERKYLLGYAFAPIYSNIIFTEGIAGSGKTNAVMKVVVDLLPKEIKEKALVIHGASINSAKDLAKNLEIKEYKDHEDLMKFINPNYKSCEVDKNGIANIKESDYVIDENGIIHSVLKIAEMDNFPSLIFIDEISKFNTLELDLINRFAQKYGITVLAAGDFDQSGVTGSIDLTKQFKIESGSKIKMNLEPSRNQFIRSFKLGISMRTANIQKTYNQNYLQGLITNYKSNIPYSINKLKYFQDEKGIFGDKVVRNNSALEDIKKDIQIMIDNSKDEKGNFEKIGYIYHDTNTELYKLLSSPEYKDKFNFFYGGTAQGLESNYYIVENDINTNGLQYLKDLYTGVTRSKIGSLIIAPLTNVGNISFIGNSKMDSFTINEGYKEESIKKYSEKRKTLLEKLILTGNEIKYIYRPKKEISIAASTKKSKKELSKPVYESSTSSTESSTSSTETSTSSTESSGGSTETSTETSTSSTENSDDSTETSTESSTSSTSSTETSDGGTETSKGGTETSKGELEPKVEDTSNSEEESDNKEGRPEPLLDNDVIVVDNDVNTEKETLDNLADVSEDEKNPIMKVVNNDIESLFYTMNTFETGYQAFEHDLSLNYADNFHLDNRIDNVYGLRKIIEYKTTKEYISLLKEIRSILLNTESKADIIKLLQQKLHKTNLYVTFGYKKSYVYKDYADFDKNIQSLSDEEKIIRLKYAKFNNEKLLYNQSNDTNSADLIDKNIVAIIGDSNGDFLEIPLLSPPNPITLITHILKTYKTFQVVKEEDRTEEMKNFIGQFKNLIEMLENLNVKSSINYKNIRGLIRAELKDKDGTITFKDSYPELYNLCRLYLSKNSTISFLKNKDEIVGEEFTIAKFFNKLGPKIITEKGSTQEKKGFTYKASIQNVEDLAKNPQFKISPILTSKWDKVDGLEVQPGHPFILITDDLSINNLYTAYKEQIENPNGPQKVTLLYVSAPTVTFEQFIDQKQQIIRNKEKPAKPIGHIKTSYNIIKVLLNSDEDSFKNLLNGQYISDSKTTTFYDTLKTLFEELQEKNQSELISILKSPSTKFQNFSTISNKDYTLSQILDYILLNAVYHQNSLDFSSRLEKDETNLNIISNILDRSKTKIYYSTQINPNEDAKYGEFYRTVLEDSYSINGESYTFRCKVDPSEYSVSLKAIMDLIFHTNESERTLNNRGYFNDGFSYNDSKSNIFSKSVKNTKSNTDKTNPVKDSTLSKDTTIEKDSSQPKLLSQDEINKFNKDEGNRQLVARNTDTGKDEYFNLTSKESDTSYYLIPSDLEIISQDTSQLKNFVQINNETEGCVAISSDGTVTFYTLDRQSGSIIENTGLKSEYDQTLKKIKEAELNQLNEAIKKRYLDKINEVGGINNNNTYANFINYQNRDNLTKAIQEITDELKKENIDENIIEKHEDCFKKYFIIENEPVNYQIYKDIQDILNSNESDNNKADNIHNKFREYFEEYGIKSEQEARKVLRQISKDFQLTSIFTNKGFSDKSINNTYTYKIKTDESLNKVSTTNKLEPITTSTENISLDEVFSNYYGSAVEVRMEAEKQFKHLILKYFLINKDEGTIIKNNQELNSSIKELKNTLYKTIAAYYNHKKSYLYYKGRVTDASAKNLKEFSKNLQLSVDELNELFLSKDKSSKDKLKAYNSLVLLRNLDTYLKKLFGDNIIINDFGIITSSDNQYSFASRSADNNKTWRRDENIDVSKEINGISKLLIETIEKYPINSRNTPIGYINFNEYLQVVKEIKNFGSTNSALNISTFSLSNSLEGLTEDTKKYIESYETLGDVINSSRINPIKAFKAIFEILSHESILKQTQGLKQYFSDNSFEVIYSLYNGIFSNSEHSIYTIGNNNNYRNLYEYLIQTTDSLFPIKYLQYFMTDDGVYKIRTLEDAQYDNFSRQVEDIINLTNSQKLGGYELLKNTLEISLIDDKSNSKILSFKINKKEYKIDKEGKLTGEDYNEDDAYKLFIQVTNLNDLQNPQILEEFKKQTGQSFYKNLFIMSARILYNISISNELLNNSQTQQSLVNIKSVINNPIYFDENNKPSINYNTGEINLISPKDTMTLTSVAKYLANVKGYSVMTNVKDGEGNTQPTNTFSRLLGVLPSQWVLQNKTENSATKDLLILNPNFFLGHLTAKEAKSKERTKPHVEFTPSEFIYSSFILDFIGGLNPINKQNRHVLGDNIVAFLPSCNSDKPTIGRILINLNCEININGVDIPIKDLKPDELEKFISQELGNMYYETISHIIRDYNALLDSVGFNKIVTIEDLYTGLSNVNEFLKNLQDIDGNNPFEKLQNLIIKYNNEHPTQRLEFIDQVHYVLDNDKNLKINKTLLSLIYRFKPELLVDIDFNNNSPYKTNEEFWKFQRKNILKGLVKEGFKVDLSNTTKQPELQYLKDYDKDWVDNDTKLMILAKATIIENGQPKQINILDEEDFNLINSDSDITLHPLLYKFNLLDYLCSEEFICSSVGSYIAHPAKYFGNDVLIEEGYRKKAQNKRNVSFTAAMQQFLLNSLNGIPNTYNVAIIEDVKDVLFNTHGIIDKKVKPYDGATFVNPFMVYLENNSLGSAKAGITKKQFIHFYNERTATGGIIKTAGFGITNDWIRNSHQLQNMMKKMTIGIWRDQEGKAAACNILIDYLGKSINYNDLYYKQNGKFYKVNSIEKTSNTNEYELSIVEVDQEGNIIQNTQVTTKQIINSNYTLWNAFGGMNSMELQDGKLVPSENSIKQVVKAMNNVTLEGVKVNEADTQSDVYQPLKYSDIHYLATEGAVKQGIANINSKDKYSNSEQLSYMTIKPYVAGIQLDKEHAADHAELSLMTQVISACASKGYTFEEAQSLYNALQTVSIQGTKSIVKAFDEFTNSNEDNDKLYPIINELIIKALGTSGINETNFASIIAKGVLKEMRNGTEIDWSQNILPLSDNTVLAKLISTITTSLTNSGIKMKIPGLLAVLTPSFNLIKFFDDRKLESFDNFEEEIEQIQAEAERNPVFSYQKFDFEGINTSKDNNNSLQQQYVYTNKNNEITFGPKVSNDEIDLNELLEFLFGNNKELKDKYKQTQDISKKDKKCIENLLNNKGNIIRFLNFYQIALNNNKNYSEALLYALKQVRIDSLSSLDLGKSYKLYIGSNDVEYYNNLTPISYYELTNKVVNAIIENQSITIVENKKEGRNLGTFNKRFQSKDGSFYQLYDLDSIKSLFYLEDALNNTQNYAKALIYGLNLNEINTIFGENIVNEIKNKGINLQAIKDTIDNNFQIFQDKYKTVLHFIRTKQFRDNIALSGKSNTGSQVRINGRMVDVDLDTIETIDYECVMPKTFINEFGLDKFISIKEVSEDKAYFIKRLYKKLKSNIDEKYFDIELKNPKGNHVYILDSKKETNIDLNKFQEIEITKTVDENNKVYRTENTNILYELYSKDDKVYKDELGNEVIVSSNPKFYLNNAGIKYYAIKVTDDTLYKELESDKKYFNKLITNKENYIDNIDNLSFTDIEQQAVHNLLLSLVYRQGLEMYTSFLKSLEIIAARIPAQSMQSFMAMKVIAFENANVNNAYVSTAQIWLQGSDYDIDAVSLQTYQVDKNGKISLWSPYTQRMSLDLFNRSLKIPFPTGKSTKFDYRENPTDEDIEFLESIINELQKKSILRIDTIKSNININININTPEDIIYLLKIAPLLFRVKDTNLEKLSKKVNLKQSLIEKIFDQIEATLDKHNFFFDTKNKRDIATIAINHAMSKELEIARNSANLFELQSSVDNMTEPFKKIGNSSPQSRDSESEVPGNFLVKILDIYRNQVGKKGIAIVATGLKTFFGLTQYNNYILNYGTKEQQDRLLFNQTINGKLYKLLSDINALNLDTIQIDSIKDILEHQDLTSDVALSLSALLSLATDNAKELQLAKLNATTKTLGMYIYGLSIGMDIKSITDILMSDVGRLFTKLLDGNLYENNLGTFSLNNTFNYFEIAPSSLINKYNKVIFSDDKAEGNPYIIFKDSLSALIKSQAEHFKAYNQFTRNTLTIFSLGDLSLENLIDQVQKISIGQRIVSSELTAKFNQLKKDYIQYLKQQRLIRDNITIYNNLKVLSGGAEEMKTLGQIFGLNQGIPSKAEDIITKVKFIEGVIQDRINLIYSENLRSDTSNGYTGKREDPYTIDLVKFVSDSEYRVEQIKRYDKVKHSFNILEAISTVPHYFQYLKDLTIAYTAAKRASLRFEKTVEIGDRAIQEFKATSQKDKLEIYKGVSNYIQDTLIDYFFLQGKYFEIPTGTMYFTESGELKTAQKKMSILLGTASGNATFKRWVETSVIPKLKKNYTNSRGDSINVSSNKFIQSLTPVIYNKNVSHNISINYVPNINMLPREDFERIAFNEIKSEFNKLAQVTYSEGGTKEMPLIKLFYYYNLITSSSKLGQNTLTSIFADVLDNPDIKEYTDFISKIDKEGTKIDYDRNALIPYIIKTDNPYSTTKDLIYFQDKNDFITKLMYKAPKTQDDYDISDEVQNNTLNGFEISSKHKDKLDLNFFTKGDYNRKGEIQIDNYIIYFEGNKLLYFTNNSGEKFNNTIEFKSNVTIPVKRNGKIAEDELLSLINTRLNKC